MKSEFINFPPSKFQLILCCIIFISSLGSKAQEFENVRSYIAYQTETSIQIDGKAEELSWENATWSAEFIDIEGDKNPTYKTRLKMLWDKKNLYFYAKMEEPHIWGTLKQRDTVIFYNNDFEIFIDPDGDTHNYYEFEMNALNTVWDLFIVKPYREPAPIINSWDIQGLQSAVHIEGTLNDPRDRDKSWSVEIAIPWDVLKEANTHKNLPEGEFWRINFSRVNWDFQLDGETYSRKKDEKGNFLPEYNWVWSPQGVINMHEPERWGYVYFSPNAPGSIDDFEIPKTERIKWHLYKLYRAQRQYYSKNEKWAQSVSELNIPDLEFQHKILKPEIELHKTGWNISVDVPSVDEIFVVRHDGDFIVLNNKLKTEN